MVINKILIGILALVLLAVPFVSADIDLFDNINISNYNITADKFIGDGSLLTNLTESQIDDLQHTADTNRTDAEINTLIDNRVIQAFIEAFGFVTGAHTVDTNRSDADILSVASVYNDTTAINAKLDATDQRYNETSLIESVNTTSNIEGLGFVIGAHTIDTNRSDAEIINVCSIYNETNWVIAQSYLTSESDPNLWTVLFNTTGDNRWLDDTTIGNCSGDGSCSGIIYDSETSGWDKNESNDFDGIWSSLTSVPSGFSDDVDNDTLDSLSCSADKIAKWNATSSLWYCADDETGTPGAGDIEGVLTPGKYLTGGCTTGTCSLYANESELNNTYVPYSGAIGNVNISPYTLFMQSFQAYGSAQIDGSLDLYGTLNFDGLWALEGDNIDVGAGWVPETDDMFPLGNSSRRWTAGWFSGNVTADYFIGDGSWLTGIPLYTHLSNFTDDIGVSADWDEIGDVPIATPSDGDTTHLSTADQIYDWIIGLGYITDANVAYINESNTFSEEQFFSAGINITQGNNLTIGACQESWNGTCLNTYCAGTLIQSIGCA